MAHPATIFAPQYCTPYALELAVVKKGLAISDGNFVVTDINDNIVFKVKGALVTLHERRVLLDASDNPIATLRRKMVTRHDRWSVFRGESTKAEDLIFKMKRAPRIQLKSKLYVYLAGNTSSENVYDFQIKGSWSGCSCAVYAGESNNIVAQMHKKHNFIGKDQFMVTVYPNVDYAFIVSLVVILNEIAFEENEEEEKEEEEKEEDGSSDSD